MCHKMVGEHEIVQYLHSNQDPPNIPSNYFLRNPGVFWLQVNCHSVFVAGQEANHYVLHYCQVHIECFHRIISILIGTIDNSFTEQ